MPSAACAAEVTHHSPPAPSQPLDGVPGVHLQEWLEERPLKAHWDFSPPSSMAPGSGLRRILHIEEITHIIFKYTDSFAAFETICRQSPPKAAGLIWAVLMTNFQLSPAQGYQCKQDKNHLLQHKVQLFG